MIKNNARYCDANCAESMREDRRAGVIHQAIHTPIGAYSAERYSLLSCNCAYCGEDVPGRVQYLPPNWPANPPKEGRIARVGKFAEIHCYNGRLHVMSLDKHGSLSDWPIKYDNGSISYDHPERLTKTIRRDVEKAFHLIGR